MPKPPKIWYLPDNEVITQLNVNLTTKNLPKANKIADRIISLFPKLVSSLDLANKQEEYYKKKAYSIEQRRLRYNNKNKKYNTKKLTGELTV